VVWRVLSGRAQSVLGLFIAEALKMSLEMMTEQRKKKGKEEER
jgi:hypothetical protein